MFRSQHADSTDQMRRILAAKYAFPEGVSPAFKDVVRRFLSVNAVHRLGSLKGGVKDVKLHPWFKVCLIFTSVWANVLMSYFFYSPPIGLR